jgi:TRAP-type C4-dicarboxylate transport system permease small subunit
VKLIKWLDKNLELSLIIISLAVMVIVMSAQIILRKLLGTYLPWSEEFCRHLFIWIGFLGISLTLRENSAIKFDLLMSLLSKKGQRLINIIGNLAMLIFFVYILQFAVDVTKRMSTSSSTLLPYSMGLIYSVTVISFVLIIIRLVQLLWKDIRNNDDKVKENAL